MVLRINGQDLPLDGFMKIGRIITLHVIAHEHRIAESGLPERLADRGFSGIGNSGFLRGNGRGFRQGFEGRNLCFFRELGYGFKRNPSEIIRSIVFPDHIKDPGRKQDAADVSDRTTEDSDVFISEGIRQDLIVTVKGNLKGKTSDVRKKTAEFFAFIAQIDRRAGGIVVAIRQLDIRLRIFIDEKAKPLRRAEG